jgi:hypothetical protein
MLNVTTFEMEEKIWATIENSCMSQLFQAPESYT